MRSYLPSVTIVGLIVIANLRFISSRPQKVQLRHPESDQHSFVESLRLPSRPSGELSHARYIAKPGDVVVHFDRNHEIQHLQYVLQNGQLATLYQHQQPSGPLPVQVQPPLELYRRDDGTKPQGPEGAPPNQPLPPTGHIGMPNGSRQEPNKQVQLQMHEVHINPDRTITVLDSNHNGVSSIVGNHVVVPMPDHLGALGEEKLDVLATVAIDALHNGAQVGEAKLHKAGIILDKLRSKVTQTLRDLPEIIDRKLQVNSSPGQLFLDKQNNNLVIIKDDSQSVGTAIGDDIKAPVILEAGEQQQQQLLPVQLSRQRLEESRRRMLHA